MRNIRQLSWQNILCLLFLATVVKGARRSRYKMIWHSFDCHNHWPDVGNLSCRIGPDNPQLLSSDMQLLRPVQQAWMKYKLLVHRPLQNNETVLFDAAFDGCKLMDDGILANKLVLNIYHNMIKDSNLAKKCPLDKGPLYFHNVNALNGLPAFLPEFDFTAVLKFFRPNSTDGIDVTLKGSLVELNRVRQKYWH